MLPIYRYSPRTQLPTAAVLVWIVMQPVIFHWQALIAHKTYLPWDLPGFHTAVESGVVDALAHGRLPLWDQYTYAGYPLHANSQAQILYPPAWPVFAMAVRRPYTLLYWLEWETVLHICLAGVFTWWLLRRAGCSLWTALFGATVYQLGFFFTSQVQHLGAVCGAAWIPLAWLAVMELSRRFSVPWFAALAAALALSFLAGFMAMTLTVYGSVAALALALYLSRRARIQLLLWTALGIVASIPLIAAQLAPTLIWSPHSQASLRWMWALGDGIAPKALLSALWPDWFHVFNPSLYKERFNFTFMYFYSGQAALWLFLAAPFLRMKLPARVFVALAIVFALFMFGSFTPGYPFLFRLLPHAVQGGIYPHFIMAAVGLAIAIAAALALETVSRRRVWIAAAVAVITCIELWAVGSNRSLNASVGDWKVVDSPRIFFERYTILPQIWHRLYATTPPQRIDSLQDEYRFALPAPATRIPTLSGDDPYAPLRLLQYRRLFAEGTYWTRRYAVVNPASPLLFAGNVGYLMHVGEVEQAPALRAAGWQEVKWDPGGAPLHMFRNTRVMPRYRLVPEIKTVGTPEKAREMLNGIDPNRIAIVEGKVECPVAQQDLSQVEVVSYRAGRVELRATLAAPAFLVAAESWAPGWQAKVNGRPSPLYPTNLAFQGVMLGAGEQKIVLEYVPTPAYAAFAISAVSWLLLIGWTGFRLRRPSSGVEIKT